SRTASPPSGSGCSASTSSTTWIGRSPVSRERSSLSATERRRHAQEDSVAEILRMDSDDVADVEEIWKTFVPSASLLRIDPADFAFRWRSATLGDLAIVRYSLTAEVHSRVQPEDQLF